MNYEQVKRPISKRDFLGILTGGVAYGIIASCLSHKIIREISGVGPLDGLDTIYSSIGNEVPYLPFHPVLMKEFFDSACNISGFTELKQTIMKKFGNTRPPSVQKLLEVGLESANNQGFIGIEGIMMGLLTVAAVGQTELDFAAHHFPLFLTEKRSLAVGWDKSRHLTSAAFWAFIICWARESGNPQWRKKADEFTTGMEFILDFIGRERIAEIKKTLSQPHPNRNFPFLPSIGGLSQSEEKIANLLTDGGIVFEILSTIDQPTDYYNDPHLLKRQAIWIATQRIKDIFTPWNNYGEGQINRLIQSALENPQSSFYCGLKDSGVNRDLVANQSGITLGIALFKLAKAGIFDRIPEIPFDDYTEKYGYWDVKIDNSGKIIGNPPPEYEDILGYSITVLESGEIDLSLNNLPSHAPLPTTT